MAAEIPNVEVIYWPAVGRALPFRLMLEDAKVAYKRTNWLGQGELDKTVVAVPCIKYDGKVYSQTMAIMEVVADLCGYLPPSSLDNKSRMTMLNIYDIQDQTMVKRKEKDSFKSMEDLAGFVDTRVKQFFVAIEASYSMREGVYFCGDRPTMVDFQLLSSVLHLNKMLGAVNMRKMLTVHAPKTSGAFNAMSKRPNLSKWINGGFGGEAFYPAALDHLCAENTPYASKKMKIYMKAGCPFCSKLAAFLGEAQLMQYVEFQPDDEAARQFVTAKCGKATFPAVEFEPGQVMIESDDIIAKFAKDYNMDVSSLVGFSFIFAVEQDKNTMMKSFTKLFKMGVSNAGGMSQLFQELEKS